MDLNRREIKRLIINPDIQVRYGIIFLTVALLLHILVTILGIDLYISWATRAEGTAGGHLALVFALIVVLYVAFYVGALVVGIFLSHKVYGPLVNIQRVLEKFLAGDFSPRIILRKHDDTRVADLANAINQLADSLDDSKN